MNKKIKAFVAMSGGVDSSVAALLLKKEGYDVVGVFMRCFNLDGCQDRDADDARRVSEKLKIPFYVWDFEDEYKKRVVEYMVDGYRKGITPNPDVMCNKEIKFGIFFDRAIASGADYVATGHYVRRKENKRRKIEDGKELPSALYSLRTARDTNKDQSYFLWTLTEKQLARCLFPIGDYLKPEVRKIAKRAGLPTADKKDSQGICFLGKVSLMDFLKDYIKPKRGEILTEGGEKIGEHEGVYFYTIGQRHLGVRYQISSIRKSGKDPKPLYVSEKDVKTNTLVVVEGENNKALYKKEVFLSDVNFINPIPYRRHTQHPRKLEFIMSVWMRVRYRQPLAQARVMGQGSRVKLIFNKPQKCVAFGQSAVFYKRSGRGGWGGLEMQGGGVIA